MKFILLFLTITAWAGLRGVGLGGGYGEMQAQLADARLPELLAACTNPFCRELEAKLDTRSLNIQTDCVLKRESPEISSCDLYLHKNGEIIGVRPFSEILALVLRARTGSELGETLFAQLRWETNETPLTTRDAELKLHQSEIYFAQDRISVLAVEGANASFELSDEVKTAIGCSGEWHVGRATSWGMNDNYLAEMPIEWKCGEKVNHGRLRVFVNYSGELQLAKIRVRLVSSTGH